MHTASPVTEAQLPHHLISGLASLTQCLGEIGVAVHYTGDIPAEDAGHLDEEAGVLWARADAPYEDQLCLLRNCWDFLTIGPHASPSAQVIPRLRLVIPHQRVDEPADEQPA